MNVRLISASAGAGKTWRLTQEIEDAIASGRARPDRIVAATFTTQAAAELIERARARLLHVGRGLEGHSLIAARIGTVNAVCGQLVVEFAFELGLSPGVRVLDDAAADLELRRALERVVDEARARELDSFREKLEPDRDWRAEVGRIIEAARANGLGPADLSACATRSIAALDACLGPVTADDLDRLLAEALGTSVVAIEGNGDVTKGTASYLEMLRGAAHELASRRGLAWGGWAALAKEKPTKRSVLDSETVREIARRHVEHPRLRAELHGLIQLEFEVAAEGLAAYQDHKRVNGMVDFVDQETLALELLRREDVREALAGEIDLFLVDEFQDTSPIQLAVFLELASLATESIWVGDPKQAIYGFRGTDPALMDAAVESLSSTSSDPELVEQAARAAGNGRIETLAISYRSRPGLVGVTNEIFARAFASHGMPEARTRLAANLQDEPAGLGDVVEHWPLELDRASGSDNEDGRAAAVAAGVRDLLARVPAVHVRARDGVTEARRRDIAVLCRTNKQCQAVADALSRLGVAAVVPRTHLLARPEARVVLAALALWVDPSDALAAAELARIFTHPTDLDAFATRVVEAPGRDAFADDPTIVRLLAARTANADLGPVAAVDAVLAATDLRASCAAWGDSAQRLANLDALRAYAITYARAWGSGGGASTVVGFLRYLEGLAPAYAGWRDTRTDRQALLTDEDAVTVSTWHRAKGLEWPIGVLFGLETVREPTSYGVHVLTDRDEFQIADPLGGRWIRNWPNPYRTPNQVGAVRTAYERTAAHAALVAKADREALRVLYVGWTRARDRLVLAAKRGKLLDGIAGRLVAIDRSLIMEPSALVAGTERVCWAGVDLEVGIAPSRPGADVASSPEPGLVTIGRPLTDQLPARRTASTSLPVPCRLGAVVELGPRIAMTGAPDMELIGDAVHAFLAADPRSTDEGARLALAADVLAHHGVTPHLRPEDIVAMASRLWRWIANQFPGARLRREWPIVHRTDSGTIVAGTADLVLEQPSALAVIDHKSFPGSSDAAAERALGYSGQLAAYAAALRAATDLEVTSTWIHFPVRGRLVEVRLG